MKVGKYKMRMYAMWHVPQSNHLADHRTRSQRWPAAKVRIAVVSIYLDKNAAVLLYAYTIHTIPYSRQRAWGKAGQFQSPHSHDTIRRKRLINTTHYQCITHS